MATCYRHPNRETGVSCSNCGNPICPDCMTPTPVGMRCPNCAKQRTPSRSLQSMAVEPIATYVLIAINVAIFFGVRSSLQTGSQLILDGPDVADGDGWRLLTSGFVHVEYWHIGMNMISLFWLGRMMEPALGHVRFVAIYFASLLTGSLGVLLLEPNAAAYGASGAIFGLFGGVIVMARNRNINLMQSGLVPILALNLILTFTVPGIAIGAHLGGLVGGIVATYVVEELARRRASSVVPAVAFCAALGAVAVIGSMVVAA
jgi:membrane associated rhomboid family serine protease